MNKIVVETRGNTRNTTVSMAYRTTYVSISTNLSRNYLLEPVNDISSYRGPSLLDSAVVLASVSTQLAT